MSQCLRLLGVSLFSIVSMSGTVTSQERSPANLTRANVVITPTKGTVYICADRKLNDSKIKPTQAERIVWLRVHNNTIWTIRFYAFDTGTHRKLLTLANGPTVGALTDESEFVPQYEFEANNTSTAADDPQWGGVGTASWLPSNVSAVFSVPTRYFTNRKLFLQYKYQWEFEGSMASESHGPEHRVYFDASNVKDIDRYLCE